MRHTPFGRDPILAAVVASAIVLPLAGCGATEQHRSRRPAPVGVTRAVGAAKAGATAPVAGTPPQALVTAQTENRLAVVNLPSGRVLRWATVPGDPGYVATIGKGAVVVVVSSGSGTVTLLDRDTLRPVRVLGGFGSPHIPAVSPDDEYAYVTDDSRGQLTVIGLYEERVLSRVSVGAGAHHLAVSPDERHVWVALGESARTIAILSTVVSRPPPPSSPVVNPGRPHVVGYLHPGYLAHDLNFTPDGRQVWVTSADSPEVGVFSARTHRLLFRVPVGPPPQHVVFAGRFAHISSGYGSLIERASLASGRVLERTRAPYGSFDLDVGSGYVVTSSLLRGTLATYTTQLRPLHVAQLAPSTEDVVISKP